MSTFCNLNRQYLRALVPLTGRSVGRPQLNGVFVEVTRHCARLVAANGSGLGVFMDPTGGHNGMGDDRAFIIPTAMVEKVARPKLNNVTVPVAFNFETQNITIDEAAGPVTAPAVSFVFPDWRRVIPKHDQTLEAHTRPMQFAAKMLEDFLAVNKAIGARFSSPFFEHAAVGTSSAARVYLPSCPDFLGVAMELDWYSKPAKIRDIVDHLPNIAAITAR